MSQVTNPFSRRSWRRWAYSQFDSHPRPSKTANAANEKEDTLVNDLTTNEWIAVIVGLVLMAVLAFGGMVIFLWVVFWTI